jgi:hypothetical protein
LEIVVLLVPISDVSVPWLIPAPPAFPFTSALPPATPASLKILPLTLYERALTLIPEIVTSSHLLVPEQEMVMVIVVVVTVIEREVILLAAPGVGPTEPVPARNSKPAGTVNIKVVPD